MRKLLATCVLVVAGNVGGPAVTGADAFQAAAAAQSGITRDVLTDAKRAWFDHAIDHILGDNEGSAEQGPQKAGTATSP